MTVLKPNAYCGSGRDRKGNGGVVVRDGLHISMPMFFFTATCDCGSTVQMPIDISDKNRARLTNIQSVDHGEWYQTKPCKNGGCPGLRYVTLHRVPRPLSWYMTPRARKRLSRWRRLRDRLSLLYRCLRPRKPLPATRPALPTGGPYRTAQALTQSSEAVRTRGRLREALRRSPPARRSSV